MNCELGITLRSSYNVKHCTAVNSISGVGSLILVKEQFSQKRCSQAALYKKIFFGPQFFQIVLVIISTISKQNLSNNYNEPLVVTNY